MTEDTWRKEMLTPPVFCCEEFHGLCFPRCHKKSDVTERLSHSHCLLNLSLLLNEPHNYQKVALVVKNPPENTADVREMGLIPVSGRCLGGGHANPLLPGNSHGQRSLMGYSPLGGKESDMTEVTSMHTLGQK